MSTARPGTGCGRSAMSPASHRSPTSPPTTASHGWWFADPEIAAVGFTAEQARQRGIVTAATEISLADSIARPYTYERDPRGALGLLADTDRQVLAGAWAVAPLASEWIHQAALAIRARIPLDVLADQVAQFPTYTEAYLTAVEQLAR